MNEITIQETSLSFELNKIDSTAAVIKSPEARGDIEIPESIIHESQKFTIISIKKGAFADNQMINSISFPKFSKIRKIEADSFKGSSIKKLWIPETVEELEEGWCNGTSGLKNIILHENNKKYSYLNEECNVIVEKNTTKDTFTSLVFASREISQVTIPASIEHVCSYSFCNCDDLISVMFEKNSNLRSIGIFSFAGTKIHEISLPNQVEIMSKGAFYTCGKLKTIDFNDNDNLKSIGDFSFYCDSLDKITIPQSVTKIGEAAFCRCRTLKQVDIFDHSKLEVICNMAFSGTSISYILIPKEVSVIGNSAFYGCTKLANVNFASESKIEYIGMKAFFETPIERITIPSDSEIDQKNNCRQICERSFEKCYYLIHIECFGKKIDIKNNAFQDCDQLIIASFPECTSISIANNAFFQVSEDFSLFICANTLI